MKSTFETRQTLSRLPILLLAVTLADPLFGQCGRNDPAFPVPECRNELDGGEVACTDAHAVRLWPEGFRPGLPGQQLPANRDSTQYEEFTVPGLATGHELFHSLDIVGNYLYVVYNAGLQVWNIAGGNAEDPQRRFVRDGFSGDFLGPFETGEAVLLTDDIAAVDPAGGDQEVLVAVSGKTGVGTSLWEHNPSPEALEQLYQDPSTDTRRIRAAELGGSVYAFGSGLQGVYVYDITRARNLASPCLDDAGSVCPGVYRGPLATGLFVHLDVIERGGNIYVAASRGLFSPLEIWELANPAVPGSAVSKFSGDVGDGVFAVELFEHGGSFYLAALVRVSSGRRLQIYNVDSCLDANGCASLGSPLWSFTPLVTGTSTYLTFSTSGNTPFLYYGLMDGNLAGTKVEGLFNLSTLGSTNQITEITDGGGTYIDGDSDPDDSCTGTGNTVDYWGDYYERNGLGLRNIRPRVGKFKGDYFYRAAYGILDVHVANGVTGVPEITTTVDDPPPHYMDQPIDFSATAESCDGPENWTWNNDDTIGGTVDANGSSATITFDLCSGADCPARNIEVWALKDACAGHPDLIEDRASVTVMEPRCQIRSVDVSPTGEPPGEYPVCTVLTFTPEVDGRPNFSYTWEALVNSSGEPVFTETVSGASSVGPFVWDTRDAPVGSPEIFADGFESGDTSAWSLTDAGGGAKSFHRVRQTDFAAIRQLLEKGSGSTLFDVTLAVSNLGGSATCDWSTQVTLTALGPLGFDSPEITVTDQGGGHFGFQANSQNATEWRWEIEDPGNGSSTGCLFYDSCHIVDWGQNDQTTYVWQPPNVPGMYGVTVSIRNCDVEIDPLSASVMVDVTEIVNPEPPVVTSFLVNDPDCTCFQGLCDCPLGQPITFAATSTGDPDTYEFDWDADGTFSEPNEPPVPVGNPITHTFTDPVSVRPVIRAVAGAEVSDPFMCQDTLIF